MMVKETEMISKRRNATTVKEIGCKKERDLSMHSNENTGKRKRRRKRARCAAAVALGNAVDAADAVKQTDREHMS